MLGRLGGDADDVQSDRSDGERATTADGAEDVERRRTPGHLASEHLDPALKSFDSLSGGKLCGDITARSLAAGEAADGASMRSVRRGLLGRRSNSLLDVDRRRLQRRSLGHPPSPRRSPMAVDATGEHVIKFTLTGTKVTGCTGGGAYPACLDVGDLLERLPVHDRPRDRQVTHVTTDGKRRGESARRLLVSCANDYHWWSRGWGVSFLGFLNNWWNLPFLVMLGLVGVFFLLQLVGIAAHGDSDVDADGDADADADHDVDHDADRDHDGDQDARRRRLWAGVMSFFGVGRVPFMVVWVTFFIFAGFAGLDLEPRHRRRGATIRRGRSWRRWPIALVVGAIGVRLFSRLAARFVDVGGRGSARKHELCGKVGVVASATVDDKFGEIRVRDDAGNEMLVHGRICRRRGAAQARRQARPRRLRRGQTELFWVAAVPELDKVSSH